MLGRERRGADAGRARWRHRLAVRSLVRRAFVVGRSWCARGCGGKRVENAPRSGNLFLFFHGVRKVRAGKIRAREEEAECWVREKVKGREEGAEIETRSRKMRARHVVAGESGIPPVYDRNRGRGRHRSVRASRAPTRTARRRPHAKPYQRDVKSFRFASIRQSRLLNPQSRV